MNNIAILLHTTFTRWSDAIKTIESFKGFKVYVADTGELTIGKLNDYKELERKGHRVYHLGWDISPAITRNFLIDQITEPYIWKVDDDFIFNEKCKAMEIVSLLENNPDIGLVGMSVASEVRVSRFVFNVTKTNKMKLEAVRKPKRENHAGIEYYYCDITPDCWIARKEIFPECNYDERYHVSEGLHTDFFCHIKFNTNWKVAYTPDSIMHHTKWEKDREQNKKSFYHQKRFRNLGQTDKFCKKWEVEKINRL